MMTHDNESTDEIEWVSKTQIKKQMHELQDLGIRLATISTDIAKKLALPDDLVSAIAAYKKIKSNSALKRQTQYIGRLMRDLSEDEINTIQNYFSLLDGNNKAHNAYLQRLEQWRDRLIAEDEALTQYLSDYPQAHSNELRTLIRNARKEKEGNKPPKAFRALFQYLKAIGDHSHHG